MNSRGVRFKRRQATKTAARVPTRKYPDSAFNAGNCAGSRHPQDFPASSPEIESDPDHHRRQRDQPGDIREKLWREASGSWQSSTVISPAPELKEAGVNALANLVLTSKLDSRNSLVPGSLTIIMAIIGTLLTALVVAREWERGTMEALLATPLRPIEILISKTVPYFALGMTSLLASTGIAVLLFRVPFRGSLLALGLTGGVFLLAALSQGLMISTLAKNQFVASQIALITGFLPSFLLSGFIFEISSMPLPLQWLTRIIPARYLVTSLQSIFLAGDVWALFLPMNCYLGAMSALFLNINYLKTHRRVE